VVLFVRQENKYTKSGKYIYFAEKSESDRLADTVLTIIEAGTQSDRARAIVVEVRR
jgi:hypothetical protein